MPLAVSFSDNFHDRKQHEHGWCSKPAGSCAQLVSRHRLRIDVSKLAAKADQTKSPCTVGQHELLQLESTCSSNFDSALHWINSCNAATCRLKATSLKASQHLHQPAACSLLSACSRLGCSWPLHQALKALWLHFLLLELCQFPTAPNAICSSNAVAQPFIASHMLLSVVQQTRMGRITCLHTLVGLRGPCTPSGMSAIASRICLTCKQNSYHL